MDRTQALALLQRARIPAKLVLRNLTGLSLVVAGVGNLATAGETEVDLGNTVIFHRGAKWAAIVAAAAAKTVRVTGAEGLQPAFDALLDPIPLPAPESKPSEPAPC